MITERAVKLFRHEIYFWELRLLSMETVGTSTKASSGRSMGGGGVGSSSGDLSTGGNLSCPTNPIERYQALETPINAAISLALTCSFPSADDYLLLLLYRCDFHRRKLQQYVVGVMQCVIFL